MNLQTTQIIFSVSITGAEYFGCNVKWVKAGNGWNVSLHFLPKFDLSAVYSKEKPTIQESVKIAELALLEIQNSKSKIPNSK